MNKILSAFIISSLFVSPAMARDHHGGYHDYEHRGRHHGGYYGHRDHNNGSIALGVLGGILVGGLVVSQINKNDTRNESNCVTREITDWDGRVYTERTCKEWR